MTFGAEAGKHKKPKFKQLAEITNHLRRSQFSSAYSGIKELYSPTGGDVQEFVGLFSSVSIDEDFVESINMQHFWNLV